MNRACRTALAIYAIIASSVGACGAASASSYGNAPAPVGAEAARSTTPAMIEGCILAAAQHYHLPPSLLVILLNVEGGSIGRVSRNTNDTVDIGPMQINEIWLPQLARHWAATTAETFVSVRDNFCANVAAGSWILRRALDEARGDLWLGVAIYHSHDPGYQRSYLRHVLREALHLEAKAARVGTGDLQVAGN